MKFDGSRPLICISILIVCTFFSPLSSHAEPLDNWHWRNPLPQGNDLHGIAFGNGLFVAVGAEGTILTSPDTITWTQATSEIPSGLISIVYGNGTFVAVGASGTVLTSQDAITWTARTSGTTIGLNNIIYANGTFVAVGASGTILTSQDAITWAARTSGTTGRLSSVAYGNGIFVAVGSSGNILTSPDAITWTGGGIPGTLPAIPDYQDISFGNGTFVAVSTYNEYNGLSPMILAFIETSSDGVKWTVQQELRTLSVNVAFGNNSFLVFDGYSVWTSPDGKGWAPRVLQYTVGPLVKNTFESYFYGASFVNGTFVVVGVGGAILTSSDGVTWYLRTSEFSSTRKMTYGNGLFVALANERVLTSPDGVIWSERFRITDPDTGALFSDLRFKYLEYANGSFVAVGIYLSRDAVLSHFPGLIVTSPDGVNWTVHKPGYLFTGAVYGNGTFVIAGQGFEGQFSTFDAVLTSPDGMVWTARPLGSHTFSAFSTGFGRFFGQGLSNVAFGNGIFAAVGTGPDIILTADDGATWTPRMSFTGYGLDSVQFINNGFFAFDNDPTYLTSPDGINWTQGTTGFEFDPGRHFTFIEYGNGIFVRLAVSEGKSTIAASPDGLIWTITKSVGMELRGLTFAKGTFLVVGPSGTILTSSDGSTWTPRRPATSNNLFGAFFHDNTFFVFGDSAILQSDPLPGDIPLIFANSSKGPVTTKSEDALSIRISLDSAGGLGTDADWWVAASAPEGWYYYVYPQGWLFAGTLESIRPSYQGPLMNVSLLEVLTITGLPAGTYTFYFGIDTAMNGTLDYDTLSYDSVKVEVSP